MCLCDIRARRFKNKRTKTNDDDIDGQKRSFFSLKCVVSSCFHLSACLLQSQRATSGIYKASNRCSIPFERFDFAGGLVWTRSKRPKKWQKKKRKQRLIVKLVSILPIPESNRKGRHHTCIPSFCKEG